MKGSIWTDEETLLWWWGFGEGVGDVRPINEHVLRGRNSIEQSGTRLIYAVGVRLIKNLDQTGARGSIADASSFLSAVECFYSICPYQVEHRSININGNGVPEHSLRDVLV